jgi:N-sulfoglucosamine sulfohydrolase
VRRADALALLLWLPLACSPATQERASFLLLVADDVGPFFLGAYGNDRVRTPHIDRLAAEGLRFDAAFTPTALCRPSRWVLYTGLQPLASGMEGFDPPLETSLLHQVLTAAGYRSGLVGKFGSRVPEHAPFDFEVLPTELKHGRDVEAIARAARRFFEQVGEQPFFLLVGFADAHEPLPSVVARPPQEIRVPPYLPDLPDVRRSLARYQTAVERLDRGVGLVLDELERAGRDQDTLVVFTSDNGPAFPFAKSTLYDAGVRMPLVVRWPGRVAPGRHSEELVSFADLRPTLLAAAGLDDPAAGRGVSLLPLLTGAGGGGREAVFLSHTDNRRLTFPMRAVRTARFKYIRNFEPEREFGALLEGKEVWGAMLDAAPRDPDVARRVEAQRRRPPAELYDLAADPAELDNRIRDPALAGEVVRLEGMLRREMRTAGDPLLDEWPDPH